MTANRLRAIQETNVEIVTIMNGRELFKINYTFINQRDENSFTFSLRKSAEARQGSDWLVTFVFKLLVHPNLLILQF